MENKNYSERLVLLIDKFIEKNPPCYPIDGVKCALKDNSIVLDFSFKHGYFFNIQCNPNRGMTGNAFKYKEMVDNMFGIQCELSYIFL